MCYILRTFQELASPTKNLIPAQAGIHVFLMKEKFFIHDCYSLSKLPFHQPNNMYSVNESYASRIKKKLHAALDPEMCILTDESHKHAGHGGAHPLGETHFHLRLVSKAFSGLNRLERHRLVYKLLSEEIQGHVHALNLELVAPEEI